MIFVTIGTQEPFDRLIAIMDEIAGSIDEEVIAQVSNSKFVCKNMVTKDFLSPTEFDDLFFRARLIISHAGMGTIISALERNKPIVVLPRIAKLGEHRNEHQLATAKKMADLKYIHVTYDENELNEKVLELVKAVDIKPLHVLGKKASDSLLSSLTDFITLIS